MIPSKSSLYPYIFNMNTNSLNAVKTIMIAILTSLVFVLGIAFVFYASNGTKSIKIRGIEATK